MTKNNFTGISTGNLIGLMLLSFLFMACTTEAPEKSTKNGIQYVDPFIGTGFHGHTFPGPVLPYGMLQLSPDTQLLGWDASSGYHYDDTTIYGFSHTHLSGTGIGDMGDILVLPFTGEAKEKPIANFSKENEQASVGSYSVNFDNYAVRAELATTMRVGIHRYTFDENTEKKVMVDLGHILQANWGHANIKNELEFVNNTTLSGMKYSTGWAYDHKVYFYAEFSSPFTQEKLVVDNVEIEDKNSVSGKNVYTYLSFKELKPGEPLLVKVSISPVDIAGARKNMEAELNHWDFSAVQENAKVIWNDALNKIEVTTKNTEDLITFYTAMYHSMIAPMTYQDVDGRYRGMDKQIHKATGNNINYTVYSLWDTFRALHPLMTIIDEKRSVDWVNNLLQKYQDGGLLPMWPLNANYTGTMVGYPAVANIADAVNKNMKGINIELALDAALTSASYSPELVADSPNPRKKRLMSAYNKYVNELEYIPADSIVKSVSFGLEMAYYDWCIANLAKAAGKDSIAEEFGRRAGFYKAYFDEETGFMRGKNADGTWVSPFNPKFSSHERSSYVEGNAWQWTWFVPHDVNGFIKLFDSKDTFITKLDTLFSTSSEIEGHDASGDITGLIGQYAHGNEPSHHISYLYTEAGEPWKTQQLVDQILKEFYTTEPDGIIGNEDCGQMSAWYVLNAMGFYQITPGKPEYTLGRPIFDTVRIPVADNKVFSIITEQNSPDNKYIQEAWLDDSQLETLKFSHDDIRRGATLRIVMGPTPKVE